MSDTYGQSVHSARTSIPTVCSARKDLTQQGPETGRESSDLPASAALLVSAVVFLVAPLALAELLPSWLVLLSLALGAVALVVRGAR